MKDIREKIVGCGLRASAPRILICEYLCRSKSHPSVDEIYGALHDKVPSLSLTTVYNTLRTFCDVGIARMLPVADGEMRFDGNVSPHAHFICSGCGSITDVSLHDGFDFSGVLSVPEGFRMESASIVLTGHCPNCAGALNGGMR